MAFLWSLCRNLWPPLRRSIHHSSSHEDDSTLTFPDANITNHPPGKTIAMVIHLPQSRRIRVQGVSLAKWPEVLMHSLHKAKKTTRLDEDESEQSAETRINISWESTQATTSSNLTASDKDTEPNLDASIFPSPSSTNKIKIFTPTTIPLAELPESKPDGGGRLWSAHPQPAEEDYVPLTDIYPVENNQQMEVAGCNLDAGEILCCTCPFASGASSQVYRGRYRGEEVVLKFITCSQEANFEKEFRRECQILQRIPRHEKIVKMHGVVGTCLVLEYCNLGSLYDLLHDPAFSLTVTKVKEMLKDIAEAMQVLHSKKIIHRDLKSGNLLVSYTGEREVVKVADFGLARNYLKYSTMTVGIGTWQYSSPEFFKNKKLTAKSDVYSFGVVLWELCTRKQPYYGRTFQEIFKCIVERVDHRLTMPSGVDEGLRSMYERCVAVEPHLRPNFKEILTELNCLLTST